MAICSALYRLKQNPHTLLKLMSEMRKCNIHTAVMNKALSVDLVSSCDYLTFFIKECLRIDPPLGSIPYSSDEDITIRGVTFPRKTKLVINLGKHRF
jgi:cytochrome P450